MSAVSDIFFNQAVFSKCYIDGDGCIQAFDDVSVNHRNVQSSKLRDLSKKINGILPSLIGDQGFKKLKTLHNNFTFLNQKIKKWNKRVKSNLLLRLINIFFNIKIDLLNLVASNGIKQTSFEEMMASQRDIAPFPVPLGLVGPQKPDYLRRIQMNLAHHEGTPGVNLRGSDADDVANVRARIKMVEAVVLPHAHTKESEKRFEAWSSEITLDAVGYADVPELLAEHEKNKKTMVERYGRQLQVSVVGAGPIGLAATIMFFKLGYKVSCFEQNGSDQETERKEREEKEEESKLREFAERPQPFSLVRQSYGLLAQLGIPGADLLEAFGVKNSEGAFTDEAVFLEVRKRQLNNARLARIGPHAEHYVPNAMSIPINKVQRLLHGVFKRIQASDSKGKDDINILFGKRCTAVRRKDDSRNSRCALQFNDDELGIDSDIIFNATGGKINELLGFTQTHIAKMYGVGVFFPPTEGPVVKTSQSILSRAVRPFCSFHKDEDFYVNMELFEKEFKDEKAIENMIDLLAIDMGFPIGPRKHFKVEIDLSHSSETVKQSAVESGSLEIPQLIINGGDAAIKPHFITASGANFGLLLLTGLKGLLQRLGSGEISQSQLCEEYADLSQLMQKQSPQMVVNLFGRHFPQG